MPEIWRNIDCSMASANKRVNLKFIQNCIKRSKSSIAHLNIRWLGDRSATRVFPLLFTSCKSIESLEVAETRPMCIAAMMPSCFSQSKFTRIVIHCNIQYKTVVQLVQGCQNLTVAKFLSIELPPAHQEITHESVTQSLKVLVLGLKEMKVNHVPSWRLFVSPNLVRRYLKPSNNDRTIGFRNAQTSSALS
jgi:hypothetical protein